MNLEKVNTKSITKFILPSVLLMIFISVYTIADNIFVSRYVGEQALASINLVIPLYSIAFACGIMFCTGGGAIIAIKLGQGKKEEADRDFTTLLVVGVAFGVVASAVCLIFRENIIKLLGAEGETYYYGLIYGTCMIVSFPFLIGKVILESVLRIDGNPNKSLYVVVIGGVINIVLDYVFMDIFNMGILGAGLGTIIGIVVSGIIAFVHFTGKKSKLKYKLAKPNGRFLLGTVANGSSEMANEFAISLTTIVFNFLMLSYMGTNGVAAITIILGLHFLIISGFVGFSSGIGPLISYNYGAENPQNIQKLLLYSKKFVLYGSVLMFAVSFIFSEALVSMYLPKESPVFAITVYGLKLYSFNYLFAGINVFGSAFFTAFENGKISALISMFKSVVLFLGSATILTLAFGKEGIWWIVPVSEFLSIFVVIAFMIKYQNRYNYRLVKLKG